MNKEKILKITYSLVFAASVPEKYKHINFVPPKSAQNAGKRVLEWKKKYKGEVKGMTPVGWARANQLAKGVALSPDVVKRMAQFARHEKNAEINPKFKSEPWRDNVYVAWLGWGNTSGINWAKRVVEQMKKADEKDKKKKRASRLELIAKTISKKLPERSCLKLKGEDDEESCEFRLTGIAGTDDE